MKKKLCYLLTVVLLFSCIFSTTAEAASKKSQVKTTTKKFMKTIKKFDSNGINKYVKSWGARSNPEEFNSAPYMKKYFKWTNKKLTYKILSTKVSGKTAKVKVRVKYVNSKNFTEELLGLSIMDFMNNPDISDQEAEAIIKKHSKTAYQHAIKKSRKYKTKTVTLTYGKYDGKWKIKKMSKNLENIIYADFPYIVEHFWDE